MSWASKREVKLARRLGAALQEIQDALNEYEPTPEFVTIQRPVQGPVSIFLEPERKATRIARHTEWFSTPQKPSFLCVDRAKKGGIVEVIVAGEPPTT